MFYREKVIETSCFRYLRDTFHFIDKRRVAVWGWSYGGFVAAMALGREQDIFQCGISVAPVTNWKLYGEFFLFPPSNFRPLLTRNFLTHK
jgi:predicted alpha/beta superfamily hydrolase